MALYTPPVTPWKLATPEAVTPTLVEEDVEGGADDWGEVVTKVAVPEGAAGSPPNRRQHNDFDA